MTGPNVQHNQILTAKQMCVLALWENVCYLVMCFIAADSVCVSSFTQVQSCKAFLSTRFQASYAASVPALILLIISFLYNNLMKSSDVTGSMNPCVHTVCETEWNVCLYLLLEVHFFDKDPQRVCFLSLLPSVHLFLFVPFISRERKHQRFLRLF